MRTQAGVLAARVPSAYLALHLLPWSRLCAAARERGTIPSPAHLSPFSCPADPSAVKPQEVYSARSMNAHCFGPVVWVRNLPVQRATARYVAPHKRLPPRLSSRLCARYNGRWAASPDRAWPEHGARMKCPTCGTDNPANARFCIQCGTPLPRGCASCGAVNPAGARFCNQCGAPLATPPPAAVATPAASATSAGGVRAEALPTPPVTSSTATRGRGRRAREEAPSNAATGASGRPSSAVTDAVASVAASNGHDAGEEHAEERRVVTILFADLTSSTALADGMDAEDVRSLLSAFFATMARQIHRHGGTVEKYIGDAVMAVFGLPVAHEDDPVRAIRAALDMQRALRQFNEARLASDPSVPELEMRIGVNTGEA